MTPADIRQNYAALLRKAGGLPEETGPTPADIRGDKKLQERVVVVYLTGKTTPAAAPAAPEGTDGNGDD